MSKFPEPKDLTPDESHFYRDQLRDARAAALADAEGFQHVLFAIERLGSRLYTGDRPQLSNYQLPLRTLGKRAIDEADHEAFEIRFNDLFDAVREARNDAMHQGAYARHVTWNATNLAIMLEDALMRDATTIADFMIRNVVCAAPWHTIGYVRQLMLANSFSILPFWDPTDSTWKLVVDRAVGIFLGIPGSSGRKQRLKMQLGQATTRNGRLEIIPARTLREHTTVTEALSNFNEKNLLLVVVRDTQADGVSKTLGSDDLVGIITAFDLL